MRARSSLFYLSTLSTLAMISCADSEPVAHPAAQHAATRPRAQLSEQLLRQRAQLAASRRLLGPAVVHPHDVSATQGQALVNALDIPVAFRPTFVSITTPDINEATFV